MQMKACKGAKRIAFVLALAGLGALSADDVTNVVARQRWPWSAKVDIDCTLNATGPRTVEFSATWQGRATPFKLGAASNAAPGTVSWTWDPASAGVTLPLENFQVTAAIAPYKFLLYGIVNGTVDFYDSKPAGGWDSVLSAKGYKLGWRNGGLLFRHVPAGVYTNGYNTAMGEVDIPHNATLQKLKTSIAGEREVIISSDYYILVTVLTAGQANTLAGDTEAQGWHPSPKSYDVLRGTFDGDGIDWPVTGFTVANGSYIETLRGIFSGKIPSGWILDLPTAAQWEIAVRAGTTTIFPNGGDETTTPSGFTNLVNEIASWAGNGSNSSAAQKNPNDWGIYDGSGLVDEWAIDHHDGGSFSSPNPGTMGIDPPGRITAYYASRKACGGGRYRTSIFEIVPGNMYSSQTTAAMGFRIVINTRDWISAGYRQALGGAVSYGSCTSESGECLVRNPSNGRVWQAALAPGEPLSWQWGGADSALLSVTSLVTGAVTEYAVSRAAGEAKGMQALPVPADGGEYLYDAALTLSQSGAKIGTASARIAILPGSFNVASAAVSSWGKMPDPPVGRVFAYDAAWTVSGTAGYAVASLVSEKSGATRTVPVPGTSGYGVVATGEGVGHRASFSLAFDGDEALCSASLHSPGGLAIIMK